MAETMKAWQYATTSLPIEKSLQLIEDKPRPGDPLGTQEVLIKVISTALNPADYKFAELGFIGKAVRRLPAIPCMDFSGRIVAVGSGITDLQEDDLVVARVEPTTGRTGALAEYVKTDYHGVAKLPEITDVDQAAGLGTGALTAYQTIVPHTKKGDRIFINGGSGGVGAFSIQIAKAAGLHVTTSCSTAKVDLCRELGADEIIDYKASDVVAELRRRGKVFDHVVDNVGSSPPDLYPASKDFLVDGGKFIGVGGGVSMDFFKVTTRNLLLPAFLGGGKNTFEVYMTQQKHFDLVTVGKWLTEGKIKTLIDSTFTFDEAPKAFERLKKGNATGKVIVHVSDK